MQLAKVLVASLGLTVSVAALAASSTATLKNSTDKTSYAMGLETGMALKRHDAKINPTAFAKGLSDGLSGAKPAMSKDEVEKTLKAFQQANLQKLQKEFKQKASENATKSAAFLKANKDKPGVKTTASGLQYKILTPGTGAKPTANDKVTVNYEGKLVNGKVFDSSYKRGKPTTFPVNGVIKGWSEGLQLMKTGATWMFYIPAKLAYGQQGVPGVIGPNDALIFKVNLIKIDK